MKAEHAFDWSEYLGLARELANRKEESCLRTSISRAYYFVYNLALNRAKVNGYVPAPGESSHAQLWRLFGQNPDAECQRLSQTALRLKRNRERADYEPIYSRISDDVEVVLSDAAAFAGALNRLPSRHPNPGSVRT